MATLATLGIRKKVKLNFLEVGHTHEDIDALIGNIVKTLRRADIPTLSIKERAICDALSNAIGRVPVFFYKSNPTAEGWYPRPYEELNNPTLFREVFRSDDVNKGFAVKVQAEPVTEKGLRQTWNYKVS